MMTRSWPTLRFRHLLAPAAAVLLPLLPAGCGRETGSSLPSSAAAETSEIRLVRQHGLAFLPLLVMQEKGLIEKHAGAAGLGPVKTRWTVLTGGAAATDALLSGSADFIATGVSPLLLLWSKTNGEVRGVAALNSIPILLNSVNPAVRSVRDLTASDRIALPAVKVSIQAVVLQMAAAREFSEREFSKLDSLAVAMKHPDAMTALLSGNSEITGHLASPPYMFQERRDPRVHTVLNSYDVVGGPHTFNVLSTTGTWREKNPKSAAAVLAALEEAQEIINSDRRGAAELYVRSENPGESVEEVLEQLNDPQIVFTTTPSRITAFADFMHRVGAISARPASWTDLFFPDIHHKEGS